MVSIKGCTNLFVCPVLKKFLTEEDEDLVMSLRGAKTDIFSLGLTLLCHVLSADSSLVKGLNHLKDGQKKIEEKLGLIKDQRIVKILS